MSWLWVGTALLIAVLWLDGLRTGAISFLVVYFPLMAFLQVVFHFLVYWELDAGHLRERRLWNTKEVAWKEVTRVGLWAQNSKYLVVNHDRLAPMSDRGSIVANPEDRERFVRALRRFAPQAEFEV
jgi:hypothetical protein